jgi:hypothetical protein
MAENKKSFVLYTDYVEVFEQLTDVEAGKLIKHLFRYVNDKNPEMEDRMLRILFEPIKQQLKRDLKEWDVIKTDRSVAGKLGNLKRWDIDLYDKVVNKTLDIKEALLIAKHRKASQSDKSIANIAVTDTVTVNVTDTVNVIPNTQNNFKTGLVVEMAKIFKEFNPSIQIEPEVHYPSCLQIAYRIAKIKGWEKQSVLNGKMNDTLESWKSIVEFAKQDTWLSTRSLIDLNDNKEWDRLVLKMTGAKTPIKKVEKEEFKSPIKKESEVDFEKYKKRN